MKTKEITLSELLSTDFIIVDNKMLGTFTLDRINMISDVLKQQKEEITRLNNIINKVIEYIEEHNIIGTNKEYLPSGIEKCYSLELMEILRGDK